MAAPMKQQPEKCANQSHWYLKSNSLHRCNFNQPNKSVIRLNKFKMNTLASTSKIKTELVSRREGRKKLSQGLREEEEKKTVPGRQGQRPEYQEVGSGDRRLSGSRGGGAFSAQGTRVLKHPRLCLSRRTPSRSHGLCKWWGAGTPWHQNITAEQNEEEWGGRAK